MEGQVLTIEAIENGFKKVINRGYMTPSISMSQGTFDRFIKLQEEYLVDQKYLNSLLPFQRREVLLMREIRNRLGKLKKLNLPE